MAALFIHHLILYILKRVSITVTAGNLVNVLGMGLHMATRLAMLINVVPLSSYMGLGIFFNYVSEAHKLAHCYY